MYFVCGGGGAEFMIKGGAYSNHRALKDEWSVNQFCGDAIIMKIRK
jgi:hypothetical protein